MDLNNSLYVGDGAGRPKEGTHKKDFSDSDLKFALNVGVRVSMNWLHSLQMQMQVRSTYFLDV